MDKNKILEALKTVKDPTTGQDIVSRGMVTDLKIDGDNVNFTINLPSLDGKHKQELNFSCMVAVSQVYPSANVNVHMASQTTQSSQSSSKLPQVKNVIAVASGKGGVGKSTVSTNLALGLKKLGARVGLIDADLYGPSIPTMFGLQGERPKIRDVYGKPKIVPLEAHGIYLMSIGFIIEPEQAVVLRGPRLSAVITQFINDCLWPELDYLIIDLPPGTGDIQLSLVQNIPVTGAVMVTTPQEVAVVDAVKAMNMFLLPNVNVPILGIVENMAWFTPAELPDNKYYIFGEGGGKRLAKQSSSMLLGQVPIVQSIREAGDAGKPIVLHDEPITSEAFMKIAKNTARQIVLRNEMIAPTQMVNMG
ncbi:MAG: Mrp/NBP35 family ATP-binding protein [Saprospiraceae bacterium]